jgi:cupin fold WbuC family metalloprotein
MLRKIDSVLIQEMSLKASHAQRKRAHFCFHGYEDKVQRMVNAYMKSAYVPPHKHEDPDKVEVFICLQGRFLGLLFDDQGRVLDYTIFGQNEKVRGVEVAPRMWHAFWALEDHSVVFEVIEGPYDGKTHKKFASWAPAENEKENASIYMNSVKKKLGIV